MFAIAVRIITSVFMSASIFFHGAGHGAERTTRESGFRRLAVYADILAAISGGVLAIIMFSPAFAIAAALSIAAVVIGLRNLKTSLVNDRGSAGWSDVFEYLTFQTDREVMPAAPELSAVPAVA